MRIQLRPLTFKRADRRFRYIIIHDTTCSFRNYDFVTLDTKKFQTGLARTYQWLVDGHIDMNFHVMVEKIGDDYEAILCRPFDRLCDYPDVTSQHRDSLHICLMGNYNYEKAEQRLYDVLIYRVLAPYCRWFRIPPSNILLHSEVSTTEKIQCPGIMFDKARLMAKFKTLAPK